MISSKLALSGLTLETAAIALLAQHASASVLFLGFLILHAGASFFAAQITWLLMPKKYRQPKLPAAGLFFLLAFFIPLLGMLILLAIVITARFFSKSIVYRPFIKVELPQFTLGNAGIRNSLGEGAIRTRLNTPGLATEVRVKALLSAQAMSSRYSVPMLKELLGDEADDLRLLAYGMLDNREKTLNALIHDLLGKLEACSDSHLNELYRKQIAELYWTFAYEHLAEGDMLSYMLVQAELHARAALQTRPDGDLWILLAQILTRQEKHTAAEAAFVRAIELGMPLMRIEPYLEELAYLRHDYSAVQKHLKRVPFDNQITRIANIQRFWLRIDG